MANHRFALQHSREKLGRLPQPRAIADTTTERDTHPSSFDGWAAMHDAPRPLSKDGWDMMLCALGPASSFGTIKAKQP